MRAGRLRGDIGGAFEIPNEVLPSRIDPYSPHVLQHSVSRD
jgi:hypothetical protein